MTLTTKKSPAQAAARLRARIDSVLDVEAVDWRHLTFFLTMLEHRLEDLVDFGEEHPKEALGVALYFLEKIPSVFDCVDCEDELADFCERLARATASFAKAAGADRVEIAAVLLRAHVKDQYGNMGTFREIVLDLARDMNERAAFAGVIDRIAGEKGLADIVAMLSALGPV